MEPLLKLDRATVRFQNPGGSAFTAAEHVNLHVSHREWVCLLGPERCGKSSLLALMAGHLRAAEGQVLHEGSEVTSPSRTRALVSNPPILLPWLSCYGNAYGAAERAFGGREPRARLRERALQAIEQAGLAAVIDRRPLELPLELQRRLGLARALAMNPSLLLLDEPLLGLDGAARDAMQQTLGELRERAGCAALITARHIDDVVPSVDRVLVMTQGPSARLSREVALCTAPAAAAAAPGHHHRADLQRVLQESPPSSLAA